MIAEHSDCTRTYIFDLRWHMAGLINLEKQYELDRRRLIYPAFLYSLTLKRKGYSMSLFLKAQELIENYFRERVYEGQHEEFYCDGNDSALIEFYREVQLLGARIARSTDNAYQFIEYPHQIEKLKLVGESLYVSIRH